MTDIEMGNMIAIGVGMTWGANGFISAILWTNFCDGKYTKRLGNYLAVRDDVDSGHDISVTVIIHIILGPLGILLYLLSLLVLMTYQYHLFWKLVLTVIPLALFLGSVGVALFLTPLLWYHQTVGAYYAILTAWVTVVLIGFMFGKFVSDVWRSLATYEGHNERR